MREITPSDKPRQQRWIRGADGRVKRASDGRSIGDIWAEQRRIQLLTAIDADKRKTEKREARKSFFGDLSAKLKALPKTAGHKADKVPKSASANSKLPRFLRRLITRFSRKQLFIGSGIIVALLLVLITVPNLSSRVESTVKKKTTITSTGVLDSKTQKPDYPTILPAGKTIEQLGGWGRVSPPDKNPVFAYVDQIAGVHITVSEQPLPDSFKKDIKGSVSDLAKQFSANDVVTTSEQLTFYVGTSFKGPQSVIFTEQGLLMLIKSEGKLTDQQWADYIGNLQ